MVVLLGFDGVADGPCAEVEEWIQSRCGGKPGWLTARGMPETIECRKCQNPLVFLSQVYSPSIQNPEKGFHRMVYVFGCWKCGRDVRAYRCMLAADNADMPADVSENDGVVPLKLKAELDDACCEICGLPGSHLRCQNFQGKLSEISPVLPRLDVFCEDEVERGVVIEDLTPEKTTDGEDTDDEAPIKRTARPAPRINNDPVLDAYIRYMDQAPSHIIRYGDERPMWFCEQGKLKGDPPACERCEAPRRFEFQLQSSLIDRLGMTSDLELAFGVIAIFTCSADCAAEDRPYVEEFAWKQNDPTVDVKLPMQELD